MLHGVFHEVQENRIPIASAIAARIWQYMLLQKAALAAEVTLEYPSFFPQDWTSNQSEVAAKGAGALSLYWN